MYAKARPKYANELLDYMKRTLNVSDSSVFADIGSGTGIFTEQLLNCGYHVYAVEPNADMRKKAEEKLYCYEKFHSVDGTSDDTTLPYRSMDYITVPKRFIGLMFLHAKRSVREFCNRTKNFDCL